MAEVKNAFMKGLRGKFNGAVYKRGLHGTTQMAVLPADMKNPKTNQQIYQRAIMATVMRAYAAGKVIFDHSFQGLSVGADNQAKFLSENAKLLRQAVAYDVSHNNNGFESLARVVAPKTPYPVPFSYKVSDGTLKNPIVSSYEDHEALYKLPAALTDEKVGEYMTRNFALDDLFTLVMFNALDGADPKNIAFDSGIGDPLADQNKCEFIFVRFAPKASAFADTEAIASKSWSDLFEVTDTNAAGGSDILNTEISESLDYGFIATASDMVSSAVIYSKVNQDLRSTETMLMNVGDSVSGYGIITYYLLTAWKQGTTKIGTSDLILEGGLGE